MLKPLSYTYKGRPLAPYGGKRKLRHLPDRRKRIFRISLSVVIGMLVLLILSWGLVWGLESCHTKQAENGKEAEEVAEEKTVPPVQTAEKPVNVEAPSKPLAANSPKKKEVPAEVSADTNRQAMQIYSAAVSAMQKKDYSSARKVLRLFFDGLQIPPGHPLYDKSCAMLSEASMAIYASGSDPAGWKEHTVMQGDNLSRLAKKYDTDVQSITESNHLTGSGLRVGQKLKIPQSSWRLRLDRKNRRLLLDNNSRLFKIYRLEIEPAGESVLSGVYRIRKTREPDRLMIVSGGKNEKHTVFQLQPVGGDTPNGGAFSLEKNDWQEIFKLITDKSTVEITK